MTAAQHRELSGLFTRFDRLTAWGCAQRRAVWRPDAMAQAWQAYQRRLSEVFPEAGR